MRHKALVKHVTLNLPRMLEFESKHDKTKWMFKVVFSFNFVPAQHCWVVIRMFPLPMDLVSHLVAGWTLRIFCFLEHSKTLQDKETTPSPPCAATPTLTGTATHTSAIDFHFLKSRVRCCACVLETSHAPSGCWPSSADNSQSRDPVRGVERVMMTLAGFVLIFFYLRVCLRRQVHITLVKITQGYRNAYTERFAKWKLRVVVTGGIICNRGIKILTK